MKLLIQKHSTHIGDLIANTNTNCSAPNIYTNKLFILYKTIPNFFKNTHIMIELSYMSRGAKSLRSELNTFTNKGTNIDNHLWWFTRGGRGVRHIHESKLFRATKNKNLVLGSVSFQVSCPPL